MIDEAKTFELYGYTSDKWKDKSHKPIIVVCDGCNKVRISSKAAYRDLCKTCCQKDKKVSNETKLNMSKAERGVKRSNMTGNHHPLFGKSRSEEVKKKYQKHELKEGVV